MPDLSQIPTADLLALKAGDLSKVSTDTLLKLKQTPDEPGTGEDIARSSASGVARGLPTLIDMPAAALAAGAEKLSGDKGTFGQLYNQNMQSGLNAGADKVLGPEYQPKTYAGKVAKSAGMAVSTLPLGGEGAMLAPGTIMRTAAAGAGGQVGGDIGQAIAGTPGQIVGTLAGGGLGFKAPQAALSGATKVGGEIGQGAKTIQTGMAAKMGEGLDAQVNQMKQASSALYKQSRESGAVLTPEATQNLISKVNQAVAETGKVHPTLHNDTIAALDDLANVSKSGGLSLEELDQQRRLLSGVINKNRMSNPEDAFKAKKALNALDDAVDEIKTTDLGTNTKEAIDALQQGRAQWSQAKKYETVANALKSADGDPNRIKANLMRLAQNEKKVAGFNAEERAALKEAASNTTVEKLLKMAGKFGFDLGSSFTTGNTIGPVIAGVAGGFSSGPAAIVGGTLARQGQKYLARGKAENLLSKLQAPSPKEKIGVIRRKP